MPPRSQSRALPDIMPEISINRGESPFEVKPANDGGKVSFDDGMMRIENEDGSVTIDFNPDKAKSTGEQNENEFYANLADDIDDEKLDSIATDLLEGIRRDEDSRKDWLNTRARGIGLLGLKLKEPRATPADSGSGEGMSSIDHPLILEATINFQATARAELLPAAGPVKVRNDSPPDPSVPLQQTSAVEELKRSLSHNDTTAQALETDLNHYLTVTATEYVPDTDRMLFYVGFGGDGFKKVYNCPLRRRPVSESVDAEDLIISNAATDMKNCGRITHHIRMRKSVLKRMQILGAYRDVDLSDPAMPVQTEVDKKKEALVGIKEVQLRPEDRDFDLYETYCELDLDEFAPEEFKGKGLPLPYRVTIEKTSQKILDLRRNWNEEDDQCMPKQFFVQFPFVRGLGFYGLGFIHLLGNITLALTATWRETIDAGMYSTFPGFIYNKQLGRQLTNQFRVPPGGGVPLELGPNGRIQDSVMPIPYKEPGGNFTAFITHVEEVGRRLASTASVQVGEGKQDAPVGTTLALIEQATKVLDSAHKRLHASQAEEFALLKERFKEDPEAFWRFNDNPTMPWEKDQFVKALNNCKLVPVADPNNPTSLHRIAKAAAIKELQKESPELYDKMAVDIRIMNIIGIDPQGLFRPQEAPPPPDPRFEAIKEKAIAAKQQAEIQLSDSQVRAETTRMQIAGREEDRKSRERIEGVKLQLEKLKLYQAGVIHDKTAIAEQAGREAELRAELIKAQVEHHRNAAQILADLRVEQVKQRTNLVSDHIKQQRELAAKKAMQDDQLQHEKEVTQNQLAHEKEVTHIKTAAEIQKAKLKPKPKPKGKS